MMMINPPTCCASCAQEEATARVGAADDNGGHLLLSKGADPHLSAKDGYTLMHGAAFSGKKSLIRKGLSFGLEINSRYGPEGITPADVAEDEGPALPYLRSMGGRTAWELGPHR